MKGFKYICWDLGNDNADLYMRRIEERRPIHYRELTLSKGLDDQEEMPGIYFCQSLDDLYIWVEELFKYTNPSAIQLLEVYPIGDVQERIYDNGRVAYVTPMCRCRILKDSELTPELFLLVREYFD
jgi:hypothetical protein